jgi:hypothetical protein
VSEPEFVFGYASLVHDLGGHGCRLEGARRVWGVAMDNGETIPGYKYFVDRESGERPAVFVAFLDLVDAEGEEVNGLCVPVAAGGLAAIDRRERNYERVDVTDRVTRPQGRTWAYAGTAAARERLRQGLDEGRAAVADEYLEAVEGGFAALGGDELERFRRTTAPPPCPLRALKRIDVPGAV